MSKNFIENIFEDGNFLLDSGALTDFEKMKVNNIYSMLYYIKVTSKNKREYYENPKTKESNIGNYKKTLARLSESLEIFKSLHYSNGFMNGNRRYANWKNDGTFDYGSLEDQTDETIRYIQDPVYIFKCHKDGPKRDQCEVEMRLYFDAASYYIIAANDPLVFGIVAPDNDATLNAYKDKVSDYKFSFFDNVIRMRDPNQYTHFEQIIRLKPLIFYEFIQRYVEYTYDENHYLYKASPIEKDLVELCKIDYGMASQTNIEGKIIKFYFIFCQKIMMY